MVLIGIVIFPIANLQIRETLAPFLSETLLLLIHKEPMPIQPINFTDSSGRQRSLSALDRLQAKLEPNSEPEIVAISVDAVSLDRLRAFNSAYNIRKMAIYNGNEADVLEAMRIGGLPTTLLIDRDGKEIARLIGPTIWDAPEIMEQLATLVSMSTSAQRNQ